ncbi:uncharacterized protein IL334_005428 [Kwoniella shivajii]|uniref:non-specific serine/threonine protein kinase n=1 Tax=Kwoniella shivajii TaxID=564305 RepID=A0ABZ1D363_9TREE|nr:hypothetical protein IL334_005428 [Kwoniella shivajii]
MTTDEFGELGTATGQELLENLIKEGLTPSGQDSDPSRYRKLVQVLLENCILKPIARDIPPNVQQAGYTLNILQRQTKIHPGLLYVTDNGSPFYKTLIPKLVYAAVHLSEDALYDELLSSMVCSLEAIGRDLPEEDVSWAKGSRRLGEVVRHMNAFCKGLAHGYVFITSLPNALEDKWRDSVVSFYDDMGNADDLLRLEVWRSLYHQHNSFDSRDNVDFAKICFLLTPITPRISSSGVQSQLKSETVGRWMEDIETNSDKSARIHELLNPGISLHSKKRKRSEEDGEVVNLIRECIPDFISDGDVLASLLTRNDLPNLNTLLPRLICALAKCHRHVPPTDRHLSDQCLDLWIKAGKVDSQAFRSLCLIIEHSPARVIATGIQETSRQVIYERLFKGLHAADRPVRSAAGLLTTSLMVRETACVVLGGIGRYSQGEHLCSIIKLLIRQLGASSAPLRSLAYTENFLETTLLHTLPALVLSRNGDALKHIASIVKQRLGVLLMDNISYILAQSFLHSDHTDAAFSFLVSLLQNMTNGQVRAQPNISIPSLMTACIVDLVVMLIVELGDEDKNARNSAEAALNKASILARLSSSSEIQWHPSHLSTLGIAELREETLKAWALFIFTLKFADVGPFVGRTSGALVAEWSSFNSTERNIAKSIIDDIADNAKNLSQFADEIVGLDDIPELSSAAARLTARRRKANIHEHVSKVLDRADSKNVAIATASIRELKSLLLSRQSDIETLVRGDTFDPIMARLMSSLLSTATRDGDCQELRDLTYECMGLTGALDPDRLGLQAEHGTMTIAANFNDQEESKDFALHLIRDLLVDAFRATNDTKHQTHLAYAIQELLKFCGFTTKIVHPNEKVSSKVRDRWQSLPKDQLETLTPLLESRFSISDAPIKAYPHPIYSSAPTYREWLQQWTTDLIGRVMSMSGDNQSIRDSKIIFGAFRGVLRNQDVTVAHHILPHLVLNVLLSGLAKYRYEISSEINAVLHEQVNPTGRSDKRTLSAQVIFDLMDHLSKWLRLYRVSKTERNTYTKVVEDVLSGIETELMANAALQSKAYARSLRSFEERIVSLRSEKRENSELQTYFERVHQIYSELDEPDGMEGISAFVISPSLEHQIREHESTGRWTSAQSCWEVRLQQSPDDVALHVGLLKCLRNLGHYGDWDTVKNLGAAGPAIGQTLLALHEHRDLECSLIESRRTLGAGITAKQYGRAYEQLLDLHLVREIEMIHFAKQTIETLPKSPNRTALIQSTAQKLIMSLNSRFEFTSPTFRIREAVLSIRRTAYALINTPTLKSEIGDAWILSSKIARKAGYDQSAYSAILQAKEADAPFAFIQQAKLHRAQGGVYKALADVDNALKPFLKEEASREATEAKDFARERKLAKVSLDVESPYYHLGHYYDSMTGTPEQMALFHYQTCHYYILALLHGVKYIYQTMPRMLTLWLDLGEIKDPKKYVTIAAILADVAKFLTAFPQIISRIVHPNPEVAFVLKKIMAAVIIRYPQHALWPTVGAMQSKRPERKAAFKGVLDMIVTKKIPANVIPLIKDATNFSSVLLRFTDEKVDDKKRQMSLASDFDYVKKTATKMILPLQDALTCTLPTTSDTVKSHNPFPNVPVTIACEYLKILSLAYVSDIDDRVDIMPSLQKPKKISFVGSDGKKYPFLCKPHDDLRKDARLMDLNSMINKLLKSASESRRRQLCKFSNARTKLMLDIRTYAVMPLNEECGLLEWVANTNALKRILEEGYARHGKKIYLCKERDDLEPLVGVFKENVLPRYRPTAFHEWFLTRWPEPSAWLASRMAYGRTLAVMSMIGYVLGVPFRLTQNLVDALGVTGVEGVYRKAAEITMGILRANSDSLMSVLEAFVHDPLQEWIKSGRSKSDRDVKVYADRNLRPIKAKLRGIMEEGTVVSVPSQVEALIKEATSPANLAAMYIGWASWL